MDFEHQAKTIILGIQMDKIRTKMDDFSSEGGKVRDTNKVFANDVGYSDSNPTCLDPSLCLGEDLLRWMKKACPDSKHQINPGIQLLKLELCTEQYVRSLPHAYTFFFFSQ